MFTPPVSFEPPPQIGWVREPNRFEAVRIAAWRASCQAEFEIFFEHAREHLKRFETVRSRDGAPPKAQLSCHIIQAHAGVVAELA